MPLDTDAVARGCRGASVTSAHQLCRAEIERFRATAAAGGPITVGCTQEAPLFAEVAGELSAAGPIAFANIRETGRLVVERAARPGRRWRRCSPWRPSRCRRCRSSASRATAWS